MSLSSTSYCPRYCYLCKNFNVISEESSINLVRCSIRVPQKLPRSVIMDMSPQLVVYLTNRKMYFTPVRFPGLGRSLNWFMCTGENAKLDPEPPSKYNTYLHRCINSSSRVKISAFLMNFSLASNDAEAFFALFIPHLRIYRLIRNVRAILLM